ncbi:MAG TPA: IS4 family transposase [Polyangiaceae bacterium]|jgi:hypothetical protein|nr:IS4 family transposase [Polyangiaceae bacterium]
MELAIVPRLRYPRRPEVSENPLETLLGRHVEETVRRYLDPERVEALAEDMRVVQRHRVHHAGLVAVAFVASAFEGGTDTEGRILDAWQTYQALGGTPSSETSFRRMAHKMVPVLKKLLRRRLRELSREAHPELRGRLESFADVFVPDGCGFKLAAALSGSYSGTGQPAELKLHAVYSVRAGAVISTRTTAGSVHDSDGFAPTWAPGALYIWDLAFNCYGRFIDARLAGAHVLQRLKDGANPIALASYGPDGHRRALAGSDGKPLTFNDACTFGFVHRQRVLDLDVELEDDQGRKTIARVVCVPFASEDRYYLTSLPRDVFSAYDVAELYRVRWEVELFFRNWKGGVRLDQVRRLSHAASLELTITASMLAALLARDINARLTELSQQFDTVLSPLVETVSP